MPLRHHLLILLYAAVMLLAFLKTDTSLSRHEVYAAQPAREMVENGEIHAVQTFAGEPRTNKPPTMSWIIALSMKAFGSQAEWVCRLPSAIAGVITAWAIGLIAARLFNPTAGVLAGMITVTTAWLQDQAGLAEADMSLVASVTVAMLAIVPSRQPASAEAAEIEATPDRGVTGAAILFWFATGIGFLLKMVAIFITLPAAILFAFWARDQRVKRILRNPWGIGVFAVFFLSWPTFAYREHPDILYDWWNQTVPRLAGRVDQRAPVTGVQYFQEFFYHFWQIPWLILPATPAVIIALWTAGDRWKTSVAAKFLIAWVAPFLLIITLTAYKSKHYSFPLLPAFSVAAAYGTMVWMRSVKRQRWVMPLMVAWFTACAVVVAFVKLKVYPETDSYRSNIAFAERVNQWNAEGKPLSLIGLGEDPITFYLRPTPRRIDIPADTPADRPIYAVSDLEGLEVLQRTHAVTILNESADRRNRPKGERLVFIRVN